MRLSQEMDRADIHIAHLRSTSSLSYRAKLTHKGMDRALTLERRSVLKKSGAGSGNQTRIACLEGRNNSRYTIPAKYFSKTGLFYHYICYFPSGWLKKG